MKETATDFVKYPRYWNYFLMRDLKSVDENRFRKNVSVELEDETRQEYEALLPRFKARRNGEWCVDSKLHERTGVVMESNSAPAPSSSTISSQPRLTAKERVSAWLEQTAKRYYIHRRDARRD
jgi:hypothetical protein